MKRIVQQPSVARILDTVCQDCGGEVVARRADAKRCRPCTQLSRNESSRARMAAQRVSDPDFKRKALNYSLKGRYGITLEQRDALLTEQGGCAICGATSTNSQRGWHVDHCHTTGRVRGILCPRCNVCIGLAGDSPEVLTKAIAYLERSK